MGRTKKNKPRRPRPSREESALMNLAAVNPHQAVISAAHGAGCCFVCGDDPASWYRWSTGGPEALLCSDCKTIQEDSYADPGEYLVPVEEGT